ncbi:ABC transporter permease [Lacticaseibacillus parakribbianus]|uniref:ABC transporter permease n=1 Tax=Lacticaseibacillus parakribbianus TaxID=2970927 RepID=UPI0021CAEECE|nr:ABC transporter permease [Lacticaseibacillus parakribbianus]
MKATWFFLRKEGLVHWRRGRFLLIGLVFLLFALESPLVARLTPQLLKSMGNGIQITLPAPTSVDSWTQFYKNIDQLGIFLFAIVWSGSIAAEVKSGTLVNLVTKGLPRYAVVLAKFALAAATWLLALLGSFLVTWAYTTYYFKDALTPHVWQGLWPLALYGLMVIAITLLGSAATQSSFAGFIAVAASVVVMGLGDMWRPLRRFNPLSLTTNALPWVRGTKTLTSVAPAFALTVLITGGCLALAIVALNRRRL